MTITQYLRPSPRHHPVERWVHPMNSWNWRPLLKAWASRASSPDHWCDPPIGQAGRLYEQAALTRAYDRILDSWRSPAPLISSKAAKAEAKATRKAQSKQRPRPVVAGVPDAAQRGQTADPYMVAGFVAALALSVTLGVLAGGFTMYMLIVLGVALGLLVAFIIFGRAQKSVFSKAEGPGHAAAWALNNMRGKWRVTPGVAATGHFDAVHRG